MSLSLGSSKSESSSNSQSSVAQASKLAAGETVAITANAGAIAIKGSEVSGKNISLTATENIDIKASENKNISNSNSSSSSASVGMSINLGDGSIGGLNVSGNKQTGKIKENGLTYESSKITASQQVAVSAGKDVNLEVSKITGEQVNIKAAENLNITSLQDQESYDEKNSAVGATLGVGSFNASINKGKINSDYQSVNEQAGVYAGQAGFDIQVGKNTDLKGAVIASEATAEKNKLSTGTLSYSDIDNKAEYQASSKGVNINLKNGKITGGSNPDIPAKGMADSKTKAAISHGNIEVRDNKTQDISNLSRNPEVAINALGKIFDKRTVQEQKELANVFSEVAFNELGTLAINNGWIDGGVEKTTIYAMLGGLVSQLAGGDFASGAASAGVNELFTKELLKIKDPNLRQLASYVVGSAAAKVVDGNKQIAGSISFSETKNNLGGEHEVKINGVTYAIIMGAVSVQIIEGQKQLVVAGQAIATWAEDTGTWIANETSSAWDDFVFWAKGKDFRGGSKNDRDKWYGYNDKEFQKWWHRKGKEEYGNNDLDNAEETKEAYDDWVSRGKPKVK